MNITGQLESHCSKLFREAKRGEKENYPLSG